MPIFSCEKVRGIIFTVNFHFFIMAAYDVCNKYSFGSGNMANICIVPPCGGANTANLELNSSPYCPFSHAIIYIILNAKRVI